MGLAFVDDHGAASVQAKQATLTILGHPAAPVMILQPVDTGEGIREIDHYDTKDGEAHPAGPASASKEYTVTLYDSDVAGKQFLDSWMDGAEAGMSELYKLDVSVDHPYPDGVPGSRFRLTRAWPAMRRAVGTGTAAPSTTTWTLRYKRLEPI